MMTLKNVQTVIDKTSQYPACTKSERTMKAAENLGLAIIRKVQKLLQKRTNKNYSMIQDEEQT
jgi:hypothetical protein